MTSTRRRSAFKAVSIVGRCWDNAPMGTKSKLQIDTQELASAGGKATQTLTGSAAPTFARHRLPPHPNSTQHWLA